VDEVFSMISKALDFGIEDKIDGPLVKPVFRQFN